MIKTVLLDVDDTLLDFPRCVDAALRKAFSEKGIAYRDEILGVFLSVTDDLWRQLEEGGLTRKELYRLRFSHMFSRLGLSLDGVAFEARFAACFSESTVPVTGAHDLLRFLKKHFSVCIASNAPEQQQLRRLSLAGMLPYTDHIFTSDRLGVSKPDKAFFSQCLSLLGGVPADTVLMIGDSLRSDVSGAVGCGLHSCWFNPAGKPHDPAFPMPEAVVSTLREVQRLPLLTDSIG